MQTRENFHGEWVVKGCWLLLILFGATSVAAQPFERAPVHDKKIKEVIEWIRNDFSEDSEKGSVSKFDQKGRMVNYHRENDTPYTRAYKYDSKGQLQTIEETGVSKMTTVFTYNKNSTVEELFYRGKSERRVRFYKEDKILEEKVFVKGNEIGQRYQLKERKVYHYDQRDSLAGEMHYFYPMQTKGKPVRRKTIHTFDPDTGRKIKSQLYDFDGELRIESTFEYLPDGRYDLIRHNYLTDNSERTIDYIYQDEALWQVVDDMVYKKSIRIFKDDRLVRTRVYMGEDIFSIVDYQYLYW